MTHELAKSITNLATERYHFALASICRAEPSNYADQYRSWLTDAKQGEMNYLANNVEVRLDPRQFLEGCQSIIMVADQYATRNDPPDPTQHKRAASQQDCATGSSPASASTSNPKGRIARYARGDDYHKSIKKRLHALADELRAEHPGHQFRAFVDTAPVLEREHAARAALGWVAKNTLLINPTLGSYLFLAGIATTLPIDAQQPQIPDHCGTCTRCIDACPTDALTPYSLDATKCISYLTIEHRSDIPEHFHTAMQDWIYGCDICQEVCPHNSPRTDEMNIGQAHEHYQPKRSSFDLLEVLGWTEEDRQAAFTRSAMKRAKLDMMKRNARIAAMNQGTQFHELRP
ncbi:MAG: tRNA epoxyqueuosine(34) reductase QueG [Planctomycetota bacterium]